MSNFSEKSFGARLMRAQNVLTHIQNLSQYNPPEADQGKAAFASFLDDIGEANTTESELEQQYKAKTEARRLAFKENTLSIIKILPQIRGAVEAKFSKKSQEYKMVSSIIAKIRDVKVGNEAVAENQGQENEGEEGGSGEEDNSLDSISKSQQSYGSLLGYFNELVAALSKMNGYAPANAALQVAQLQAFAESLDVLNQNVMQKAYELHEQRKERLGLYRDLSGRVQKIKAYVKSEYGATSDQYEQIRAIEV
jgi:hypothetical protein